MYRNLEEQVRKKNQFSCTTLYMPSLVHFFFASNGQIWCRFTISETFNCYCISSMTTIRLLEITRLKLKYIRFLAAVHWNRISSMHWLEVVAVLSATILPKPMRGSLNQKNESTLIMDSGLLQFA